MGEGCQSRGGLIGLARSILTEMARTRAAGQHVEPMGYSTGPTPYLPRSKGGFSGSWIGYPNRRFGSLRGLAQFF